MSEWKEYKLGEIGDVITGKTPSLKNPEHWGADMLFVTPTDFDAYNKNIYDSIRYLSKDGISAFQKKILSTDSVLVTCIGSQMGKVAVNKKECVTNQQINSVVPYKEFNADFIYYFLSSMQDDLRNLATGGSTMPILNKSSFENITISIPELPAQIAIAEVLSSLDEKIELNNAINKNLEALAQSLFKRWFVDYEFPNEEGLPYKSSGGEMVESEFGMIPKGWRPGTLGELSKLKKESVKTFSKPDDIYLHFSIPEFDGGKIPLIDLGANILSSKYRVFPHSVLVSKLNPRIPRIWPVIDCPINSVCSTEFQVINPNEEVCFSFIACLASSEKFISSLQSKITGTSSSHQRVNPKDIIGHKMVIPDQENIHNFAELVYPLFKLMESCREEYLSLKSLRDTLLPKLISGELEVKEALAQTEISSL